MGERLTFTFALTGRRNGEHGTQGVALGSGLVGLSARAGPQTRLFPHSLHQFNLSILNTLINSPPALRLYSNFEYLLMVQINKDNLHLLLPGKICWLVEYLREDYGFTLQKSLNRIYHSKLYKKLSTASTLYWHLGPVDLYNELKTEI